MEPLYDVAFSFLSQDEPLASALYDELAKDLKVFVYSNKQKELAGADGVEVFRQTFYSQSRMQVVLYRNGWGKTDWTAIEERAISERGLRHGWDSILFVNLDGSKTPGWLPETRLWLNFERFGHLLAGAIKFRALELGSKLVPETALDRAKRLESVATTRRNRETKLTYLSVEAATAEWNSFCIELNQQLAAIQTTYRSAQIAYEGDGQCFVLKTRLCGTQMLLRAGAPPSESRIFGICSVGPLLLPSQFGHMFIPGEEAQEHSRFEFQIDYSASLGFCWRALDGKEALKSTAELADLLIKRTLQLHEDVESGKVRRHKKTIQRTTIKRTTPWS
jgi:hypothetical protein